MRAYFVRSNGDYSVHSLKSRPDEYVEGEPGGPFNFRLKCLKEGFARIGWPNTGNLLCNGSDRLARDGYSLETIPDLHRRYLEQWADIRVGDLITIPADTAQYEVHLGIVVQRSLHTREELPSAPGDPAYYYFHNIAQGDWYECAHRVDVRWHTSMDGVPIVHYFPELGGTWLRAFSRLTAARPRIEEAARHAGLI